MSEKYMTPKQVADHYNVPLGRVYTALNDGRIKSTKVGWAILIPKDKLPEKWPGRSSG